MLKVTEGASSQALPRSQWCQTDRSVLHCLFYRQFI